MDIKLSKEILQYERKIYDLKQLIEISKGLNSTLDYNVLIDSILLTCMGQLQLVMAGIFTKKAIDQNTYLLDRNYKGFELEHNIEYEIAPDSKIIKAFEDDYRCYKLKEMEKVAGDDESFKILKIIDPRLLIPLKAKGKINGIIILGEKMNKANFSVTEREFLLNVASLAGIAIENAYLYEVATTDMMTKLKIHHFFQTALLYERERADEGSHPLSIIMIDVDNFKEFNDTYGHICGDIILVNVAKIVMDSIRLHDVAARYGGEEFVIILPGTMLDEALVVAERIRKSVEDSKIMHDKKELNVQVSLGVTQYDPSRDTDNRKLIERVDKAMYMSKQNGKNMVSFLK